MSVEIGGFDGVTFDFNVTNNVNLFRVSGGSGEATPEETVRAWIVDVDGTVVPSSSAVRDRHSPPWSRTETRSWLRSSGVTLAELDHWIGPAPQAAQVISSVWRANRCSES